MYSLLLHTFRSHLMPTRQLNVRTTCIERATLRRISFFGTNLSRPARHGHSAAATSGASGTLLKVPSRPSTVLRFKHIPSTATLNYLLDLSCQYGRVLRAQSRKSTQLLAVVVVLMYYLANPIKPASDLVFVEFEKMEDAVRAKESIERNMEDLFEWEDQESLAMKKVRWKGHRPPKPNRRLQIAFVADLPVHWTPPNAKVRLHLRNLPPGAESAIENAMRLSQSRVGQWLDFKRMPLTHFNLFSATAIDGSYYIECSSVLQAISIRDEYYGTRHRLTSIEGRLPRKEYGRVVTLNPILVILSEKGDPRYVGSKPKATLPRIGIDSSSPLDIQAERFRAKNRMVWKMRERLM